MRLEQIPFLAAALMALLGAALLIDGLLGDRPAARSRERRRRARAERHRPGEALLGLGLLALAGALAGRDRWALTSVAILVGAVCLVAGSALNAGLLRELVIHRGAARRQAGRAPRGSEVAERHPDDAGGEVAGRNPGDAARGERAGSLVEAAGHDVPPTDGGPG